MTTLIGFALLVAGTLAIYAAWSWLERRRHRRAHRVLADVAALGDDAVPVSIHPHVDPDRCMGSGSCVRACPEGDVLAVIDGRARLVNPLACIGHGACMAACPVDAIQLVFGTARRGVELPRLDADFQTSRPGLYVAGELGGMGLIRNAIEQGRQVAAAIARGGRRGGAGEHDVVVVGAGPAGIACALAARQAGLRAVLLEQADYGGTIRHYPRRKVVMTGGFELPIFGRVRRRTMSKEELCRLWDDVRARTDLAVVTGARVDRVEQRGVAWEVSAGSRGWRAASVVLAVGRRGAPRRLGVPGEELGKVHDRLLEPEPLARQHVLVVGGGNAAAESALALVDAGLCASVTLSYRRPALARLRGAVRARVDAAIASGALRAIMPSEVVSITERSVELATPSGAIDLVNDAVIVQIGGTAPEALLAAAGVDTVEHRGARTA